MPYDDENVDRLRNMLREARKRKLSEVEGEAGRRTVNDPHLRFIKDLFVATGPDIGFKSRPEARDWCKEHYPGSR